MKIVAGTFCILICTAAVAEAAKMDITACGQEVPHGTVATLTVDLSACPSDSNAVTLRNGAKLYLNGFAVASGDTGVFCINRCSIRGPGEITGARDGVGTVGIQNARLVIKDVDIHDNTENGIRHNGGIEQGKTPRVRLTDVSVRNNGNAGIGVFYGILSGTDVNVSDNGGDGIGGIEKFKFKRLTVQRNGGNGLASPFGGGRLMDSLLSFNGSMGSGVDLKTLTRPELVNTLCGFSEAYSGGAWGVCAGD